MFFREISLNSISSGTTCNKSNWVNQMLPNDGLEGIPLEQKDKNYLKLTYQLSVCKEELFKVFR